MKTDEKLSLELLWQGDGHVTDVVVTALADGQDTVVPLDAAQHVASCDACTRRLGQAALLSFVVGEQLATQEEALIGRARPVGTWPLPFPAVAAALALAALGALPTLWKAPAYVSELASVVARVAPQLVRSWVLIAQSDASSFGPTVTIVGVTSVVILVLTGLAIAKAMPRSISSEGGV